MEDLDVSSIDRIMAVSLSIVGVKCLKLKEVFMRSSHQESINSLHLHFPHIHWYFLEEEEGEEDEKDEKDEEDEEG